MSCLDQYLPPALLPFYSLHWLEGYNGLELGRRSGECLGTFDPRRDDCSFPDGIHGLLALALEDWKTYLGADYIVVEASD